ncbi:MAG: SCO family protein [Gemmatimonadota bacterium]
MRPLVVITLLVLSIVGCAERPWHGIVRSPAAPAPALVLAGAADLPGTRIRLDSLRGEVVVLYFGYTHCPDVCPTTLADWARAKRTLGADTTGIRWIFVSVDPTRDSPAEAHGYARQFDPAFTGTAPTDAELALLLKDWAIAAYPEGDPRAPDYTVAHPAHTFVVDADGRFRLMIPPGVRADDIADDLRRLR